MKTVITVLLLLANIAAAAPTDSNDITNIPVKSKILFSTEVGFLPNTSSLMLFKATAPDNPEQNNHCWFTYFPSQDARNIQPGRALSIVKNSTKREYKNYGTSESTALELENKLYIVCERIGRDENFPSRFTIGELRSILARLGIQLSIAPSVPM